MGKHSRVKQRGGTLHVYRTQGKKSPLMDIKLETEFTQKVIMQKSQLLHTACNVTIILLYNIAMCSIV